MRSNALTILVTVIIGVSIVVAGQNANAQEFRKEIMKGIFQTIGPDVFKDMAKSMATELTKNEEFRKQVIQQVIREVIAAIGPENMKDIVKSVAAEAASANEVKIQQAACPTSTMDADSVRAMIVSAASEFTRNPGLMDALKSGGLPSDPQALLSVLKEKIANASAARMRSNSDGTPASKGFRNDLIAVITHPSNPVDTLTVDQIRKLFNGEYTNWSQVGGTDLPVQLIASRDIPAALESLLDTHLAPSAVRVPLLSFLFVGVAETEGALGFLPTHNVEQLEFVRGNGAIKKIAIKKDDRSPAQAPHPGAVISGAYPLVARDSN